MQFIKNISDLRAHIRSLEIKKLDHELFLNQKVASIKQTFTWPINTFHKLTGFITGKNTEDIGITDKTNKIDFVKLTSRVIIPFVLNKIFFRKSNFIVKTIISLASQGAISSINKNTVAHWVDKLTHYVKSKTKKKNTLYDNLPADSKTN